MKDALTIVVVHISRQQGQSLLDVDQGLRLQTGSDFLQHIDEARQLIRRDPTVQRKPIEPRITAHGLPLRAVIVGW